MELIRGTIESVIYFSEENAFAILSVKSKQGKLKAKGVLPDCQAIGKDKIKGLECELKGVWKKDPKWGYEFNFSHGRVLHSDSLLFFLSKVVKGLGEKLARELIDHYGEERLTYILDNDPEQLMEFKGIKEKKLAKIVASWNKYRQLKELSEFFAKYNVNITSNLILRIYNTFKDDDRDIIAELSRNPYVLTEVRGIGFKTADKIALQMNIPDDSPRRVEALLDYILQSEASDNGHTYLTFDQIMEKANEYVYKDVDDTSKTTVLKQLVRAILKNHPEKYYFEEKTGVVALKGYNFKEKYIFDEFMRRLSRQTPYKLSESDAERFITKQENRLGFKFSKEQREAIKTITTTGTNTFILCGYAGTGKSTISKVILDFYSMFVPKEKITCCAFTGMASKRIKDVTGYQSSTIHSLLKFNGEKFEHGPDKPLPYDVILLDEASMVNLDIFYYLLRAVKKDAVFVLVGDDAQLPPIGAGNVFNDLLKKDWIPKTKLTKIYRQSENSVITYFASFIRKGELPKKYVGKYDDWYFEDLDIKNYFALKKTKSEKELTEIREEHYQKILKRLLELIDETIEAEHLNDIERIWDIQVITAMRKTPLGTKNLNAVLQQHLNGKRYAFQIRNRELRLYDKVIHLKNKNMKVISRKAFDRRTEKEILIDLSDIPEQETCIQRIYNGALGLVYHIDENNEEFLVAYPDTPEWLVKYSFDDYGDIIDLGYALTIHKTQGNQFNHVFMPMINGFYIMLNSKLLYTGITRAIKRISIVGQKYAFKRGCTNLEETVRQTFLDSDFLDSADLHI